MPCPYDILIPICSSAFSPWISTRVQLFYLIQRVRLAIERSEDGDLTEEAQVDVAIASTPSNQRRRHQESASTHTATALKDPARRKTTTADSGVRFRRELEVDEEVDAEGYARASRRTSGGGSTGFGFKQAPSKLQRFPSSHRRSITPREIPVRSSTPRASSARQIGVEDKMFSSGRTQERRRGGEWATSEEEDGRLPPRKEHSGEEYLAFERRLSRQQSLRSESALTSGNARRSRASSPLPLSPRRSVHYHSRRESVGDPCSEGVSRSWDLSDGPGETPRNDRKEVEVYSVRSSRRMSSGSLQSRDLTVAEDSNATEESKRITRSQARTRSRLRLPSGYVEEAVPNDRRNRKSTPTDADAGAGARAVSFSRRAREAVSSRWRNRDSGSSGTDRGPYRDRDSTEDTGVSHRTQDFVEKAFHDVNEEQAEEDMRRESGEQTERVAMRALANHIIAIHREDVRRSVVIAQRDVELVSKAEKDRDPVARLEYAREVEGMLEERLDSGARLRAALDSYMSMRQSTQSHTRGVGRKGVLGLA